MVGMNASKSTCEELMNKSIKLQDRAKRRNVGEDCNLANTIRRLTVQQRVSERALDTDIKLVIDKQRKLGYRTFSLPEDMELSKTESLKRRVMKAARLDHGRPVPIGVAMRSWADTSKKTVKANREGSQQFNTMEVIENVAESVDGGDSGIVCDKPLPQPKPLRRQQSMEELKIVVAVGDKNITFIKTESPTPSR